jgi:Plasmid replication region DNA-binding N-term
MEATDVAQAIETLQAQGQEPSIGNIRKVLGHGSLRDITRHRKKLLPHVGRAPHMDNAPVAAPVAVPVAAPAAPPPPRHPMLAGRAELNRRRAQEVEDAQADRERYIQRMQPVVDAYILPRPPAPPPPAVAVPPPAPRWDAARPWLPQALAVLALAQRAERQTVRAVSFGTATAVDLAEAQTATRAAQQRVDALERSLAAAVRALPDYERAARGGTAEAQEELDRLLRDIARLDGPGAPA